MLISKKTMRKRCESAVKLMKEKELKAIFLLEIVCQVMK